MMSTSPSGRIPFTTGEAMQTSVRHSLAGVVVINVDVLRIRAIIIYLMFMAICQQFVPRLNVVDLLIVTNKANANSLDILTSLSSFCNLHFLV